MIKFSVVSILFKKGIRQIIRKKKKKSPYPNVLAPDNGVCHGVPEVAGLVIAGRQELVVTRVWRQSPQLLSVSLCGAMTQHCNQCAGKTVTLRRMKDMK